MHFLSIKYDVRFSLFIDIYYQAENSPSINSLLWYFSWIFTFFQVLFSASVIGLYSFLLQPADVMGYFDWILDVNHSYIPVIHPLWSWCINLSIQMYTYTHIYNFCKYYAEGICIYSYKKYWSVGFFLIISLSNFCIRVNPDI